MQIFDANGKRLAAGWAALFAIAAAWSAASYFFPPFGMFAGTICAVCVFFDWAMNGAANAEWVPFNLAGAALGWGFAWLALPP